MEEPGEYLLEAPIRMHTSPAVEVADGIQCMLILGNVHWEKNPKFYIYMTDFEITLTFRNEI